MNYQRLKFVLSTHFWKTNFNQNWYMYMYKQNCLLKNKYVLSKGEIILFKEKLIYDGINGLRKLWFIVLSWVYAFNTYLNLIRRMFHQEELIIQQRNIAYNYWPLGNLLNFSRSPEYFIILVSAMEKRNSKVFRGMKMTIKISQSWFTSICKRKH